MVSLRGERDAALPAGWFNVELILKVNADRFSIGHSYNPNAVNVLRVVVGVVG